MRSSTGVKSWKVLIALLLVSSLAFSQPWRPARLLNFEGDTLIGEIQFADPEEMALGFNFRKSREDDLVVLTTLNIKSFQMLDSKALFEKLETAIDMLFTSPIRSGQSPVESRENLNVFAEVLITGADVKLYLAYDRYGDERFFVRKGNELTELTFLRYRIFRDGKEYNVEEPRYKGQVRQLFSGCVAVVQSDISFTVKSLTQVVAKYISCKGAKPSFQHEQKSTLTAGAFGAWVTARDDKGANNYGMIYGASAQLRSRKHSGNRFVWLDIGALTDPGEATHFYYDALVGSYLGRGTLQPLVGVGFSNLRGFFCIAAGVSLGKRITLTGARYARDLLGPAHSVRLTVFMTKP
jgi:hypothetical protein